MNIKLMVVSKFEPQSGWWLGQLRSGLRAVGVSQRRWLSYTDKLNTFLSEQMDSITVKERKARESKWLGAEEGVWPFQNL